MVRVRKTMTAPRRVRLRPVRPAGWWFDGLLLVGFVALTLALVNGYLLGTDLVVRDWVDAHRPDVAYWIARVFNYLGQGGWLLTPVASVLAVLVSLRTRSIRPLLVVAAAFLLTYLTIGPLKFLLVRGYPHNWDLAHPEQLFSDPENGSAYPSGHVANAIVWYGVIALLLAALLRTLGRPDVPPKLYQAIRIAPPAIVFVTTTYLGFHWLTDSIAGLLLGWFLDRLLARVPWDDLPLPALPRGLGRAGVFTTGS
ncbi:phosphatase PAP2 family protein [Micromonospora polyrhachis]|uniref:phosphatase PAP2 family protein n=1 Tax=Micromonospora polyrhachis TaxID=1282883 RepID=UPI0028B10402|nr:phosphatase PAP2 family protein [Micromonospora polyrhachis]